MSRLHFFKCLNATIPLISTLANEYPSSNETCKKNGTVRGDCIACDALFIYLFFLFGKLHHLAPNQPKYPTLPQPISPYITNENLPPSLPNPTPFHAHMHTHFEPTIKDRDRDIHTRIAVIH